MRFSLTKNGRTKSTHNINWFPEAQHPDRRSIAVIPGGEQGLGLFAPNSFNVNAPDDFGQPSPALSGGLSRSQTVLRREGAERGRSSPLYDPQSQGSPSPIWSPDFIGLPTPSEQHEVYDDDPSASMSGAPGKTSSDSGQSNALDRWSQRRLQRLNTEQGFREQRQGGQGILSPPPVNEQGGYNNGGAPYSTPESQPQAPLHQQPQPQPHPAQQQPAYQSARTGQPVHPNAGLAGAAQTGYAPSQQQHSPPDSGPQYTSHDPSRPALNQSRSYSAQTQQQPGAEDLAMSSSNNGPVPPNKASRSGGNNRQSVHNGLTAREVPAMSSTQQQQQQQGVAAFNASVVPPVGHGRGQTQQQGDVGRITPQPQPLGEDMSEEDVTQLVKDHKELREKYTKVKKYYFEKEDQVKQLQNSLAHQRLSQSRTSLDDSEYTTRFNRLDGLVAQLAFSIRKSWRSIPHWLDKAVNKDAVATGKQEMTAVGRAIISQWLVDEVFNKCFHPDLDPVLSAQLKMVQVNIRKFAPPTQTVEEEEFLTSKVVNWRLSTLEGLQESLRSPQCPQNRATLTDMLKERLIAALSQHLQEPAPSDLEGGVHMIIELVVSIAIHLPLESRDVVIEYFTPGYSIMNEQMKLETGIPALTVSVADDAAERASMKSAASDITDITDSNSHGENAPSKKRSMLSALTGTGKPKPTGAQGKHSGAGGSSSSLNRPESSQGMKEDVPPRVRMAAGIGVQIRGRSVLVKAPVFGT